ncbi:MAG: FAD-dependent oxidoreductase, partial [Solirubrobacteraceae bacterium]
MSTTPSFWLDQLGSRPPRPALAGDREADVCIIGAGFTGLWTAYELLHARPGLEVVVLEGHQVGFGASGRNGGWVLGKLSGTRSAWRARGGPDGARAMVRAIQDTVGEIGAVVEREGIDCDWRHSGTLTVAQSEVQLQRLRATADSERRELGED